jgi:hypothetical protein
MPSALYRAMVLNGGMAGATVYAFTVPEDLWAGSRARYWQEAILPSLRELASMSLIARKEFVAKRAPVAYQLALAGNPLEFHANLRDLDAVRDEGFMLLGAYGAERPGQVPELIPNTGRHYWVPVLSPYAPAEVLNSFGHVAKANELASADAWTQLLDQFHQPDGTGTAFITRVGRGVFVMHTRENAFEEQTFQVPELPAPIVAFEAERTQEGVVLKWPFREGDVSFNVFKRPYPSGTFERVAEGLDRRAWTDPAPSPDAAVSYTVTALTNEKAPYQGTVNYGDYRVFSTVESRIAEEVIVSALTPLAKSTPLEAPPDTRPKTQAWWPGVEGLPEDQKAPALEITARIEQWDAAFQARNLDGVLDVYTTEYQDPQWWRFQYVKRAYQWFFERYRACRMARQVRQWDFAQVAASGQVRVLLYCRFSGAAISDPSGHAGDDPAWFPRHDGGEVWITFSKKEGSWRIERTEPALPNFAELLAFATDPYTPLAPGPDVYPR